MTTTVILHDPIEAARMLAEGRIVAVPTETVFGLAARFDRADAVSRIFRAKGRPADNPLIVHLGSADWLPRVAAEVPWRARRLLDAFAPGPLTVTVPRGAMVSDQITAGLPSVAVRIPDESRVREVLRALDVPIVAPSANRSGRPSPTTWEAVWDELRGRIDAVLVGQPSRCGIESTVVDCCAEPAVLLRPGAVSLEDLAAVLPEIQVLERIDDMQTPLSSPGLRYRHYSPAARVVIIESPGQCVGRRSAFYLGIDPHAEPDAFAMHRTFASVEEYAHWLFALFRMADAQEAETILCQRVPMRGIGRGLMDRIERAAMG